MQNETCLIASPMLDIQYLKNCISTYNYDLSSIEGELRAEQ